MTNEQERFLELKARWEGAKDEERAILEQEARMLPRAARHRTWCDCATCKGMRLKGGGEPWSIKLPADLKEALKERIQADTNASKQIETLLRGYLKGVYP